MRMKNIIESANHFGKQVAAGTSVLPRLALLVAHNKNRLDEDDARDIYMAYLRGVSGARNVDLAPQSARIQISKLRQIIKLSNHHKSPAKLLAQVIEIHQKQSPRIKGCYAVMVEVARFYNNKGRVPTPAEIARMCKKR